jgi:capsule polysaccharide export protein KpsE/RkpR
MALINWFRCDIVKTDFEMMMMMMMMMIIFVGQLHSLYSAERYLATLHFVVDQ